MRTLRLLSATLLGAALAGCAFTTAPDGGRVVGILYWISSDPAALYAAPQYVEPAIMEVPDTVTAGAPFDIMVRTYGANGCWSEAGAEVVTSAAGMALDITPYDRDVQEPGIMCTEAIVRLPRVVRTSFPRPGQATVRVTGRRILDGSGAAPREEPLTIEKTVVVR